MLTEYQPRSESTDSEYNDLRFAYVARGASIDALLDRLNDTQAALDESASTAARLRVENAELRAQLAGLNAHIEADHDFLRNTLGVGGLVTAHNPHTQPDIRTLHAADDGPEVNWNWEDDEDSGEYQFPESPKDD